MTLDFSQENPLPKAKTDWQQHILDFILVYKNNIEISVQTSGSTGTPKILHIPKVAVKLSAQLTSQYFNLQKGQTALLCMPVSYIAGKLMVVRAIENQMKLVCVQPKTTINFNKGKIDFTALTPMQAQNSMQFLAICDKVLLGGAAVSSQLENELKPLKVEFYESYGMTETITHIAIRKLNEQSYFHILPRMRIRQDDRDCLVIQTPYFENEIITNDVVELGSPTSFKIKGRVDNIINSGGIKINPEELEKKLEPYINQSFIVHFTKGINK